MKNILIVEDNPKLVAAAHTYFKGRSDIAVTYAGDYVSAISSLRRCGSESGGLITDILFPYRTGTGDRKLGMDTLYRMMGEDRRETQTRKLADNLKGYGITFDGEMCSLVRVWNRHSTPESRQDILYEIGALQERGFDTNPHLKRLLRQGFSQYIKNHDGYGVLEAAITKHERNQPLCIPLGEQADKMGIPFVIATSTCRMNALTKPVFDYAGRVHDELVEHGDPSKWVVVCSKCEGKKYTPKFWKKAYGALHMRMPRDAPNGKRHLVTVE